MDRCVLLTSTPSWVVSPRRGSYLSMINPLIANTIASLTPSKNFFLVDHIGSYNSFPVFRSLCIYIKINNPHGANYDATGTGNNPRVIGLLKGEYTCHRCGCAVFLYFPIIELYKLMAKQPRDPIASDRRNHDARRMVLMCSDVMSPYTLS